MDIRLTGVFEQALVDLQKINYEPSPTGMARIIIREAALRHGVWPQPENGAAAQQPQSQSAQPAEAAT